MRGGGPVGDTWVDLSIPLRSGMSRSFAYPPPVFEPTVIGTQENGEPITATRMELFSHVGTHIESPRHILGNGPTLDDYPLERFAGPCVVLDVPRDGDLRLEAGALRDAAADMGFGSAGDLADCFVLVSLARDQAPDGGPEDHAYLSEDAAQWLVQQQVRGLGVDAPTPDMAVHWRAHRFDLPVHRALFAADLLIMEYVSPRLRDLAGTRGTVHAWPLAISGSDSSPVRVVFLPDNEHPTAVTSEN
jgi:arylformamidase